MTKLYKAFLEICTFLFLSGALIAALVLQM